MESGRRPKRVANLIKEALGPILVREFQGGGSGLITVTRVEMTADLQTARVYLSFFGGVPEQEVFELIEQRTGYLRKCIASEVKLKYNPHLIFVRDPAPEYERRLDRLMEHLKDEDK
ncbi:MAG: ribosome-binding factor A [Candidatus Aminicenantes bacterium RBG_16_63_16]|nr:MAG: ribosome-binding factor A [Candidatus Aminicenantes bacterium RBG_16_63_16]